MSFWTLFYYRWHLLLSSDKCLMNWCHVGPCVGALLWWDCSVLSVLSYLPCLLSSRDRLQNQDNRARWKEDQATDMVTESSNRLTWMSSLPCATWYFHKQTFVLLWALPSYRSLACSIHAVVLCPETSGHWRLKPLLTCGTHNPHNKKLPMKKCMCYHVMFLGVAATDCWLSCCI